MDSLCCTTCVLVLIVFLSFHKGIVGQPQRASLSENDLMTLGDYSQYYSFNRTKEVLMKYYDGSDEIKNLVDEYDFRCTNNKRSYVKKFPFVTVEGCYRRTRNIVAHRLAKRIEGRVVGCPPQFMTLSQYYFNDTTELRRAFYSLGVHATACKVKEFLATSPVVVAGYWVDQTAFGVAKMFSILPPESSPVYLWPEELLKPDKVYLINSAGNFPSIPLHPYKPMRVSTFKDRLLETMMLFREPSVTEVKPPSNNFDDIVNTILHFVNTDFHTQFYTY